MKTKARSQILGRVTIQPRATKGCRTYEEKPRRSVWAAHQPDTLASRVAVDGMAHGCDARHLHVVLAAIERVETAHNH